MKTITGFLATENNYSVLTIDELILIKGGEEPQGSETDPFKKKN